MEGRVAKGRAGLGTAGLGRAGWRAGWCEGEGRAGLGLAHAGQHKNIHPPTHQPAHLLALFHAQAPQLCQLLQLLPLPLLLHLHLLQPMGGAWA